jgi:glycosyltransferase involved in cell wall biosynthesis
MDKEAYTEENMPPSDIRVSVVIPCYNHGKFLGEAIDSVLRSDFRQYEIIVVNDGSTDPYTVEVFKKRGQRFLHDRRVSFLHQANAGLSAARNAAIAVAKGEYILPLDADNRIRPQYMSKAVDVLDSSKDTGVVYTYADLFGEKNGMWVFPPFDAKKLLLENFVEACSVFRKKIWEQCNGYDPGMTIGYEDWDFWISAMEKGWGFHLIEEVLFDYRVRKNSMASNCNIPDNDRQLLKYICDKHRETYLKNLSSLISDVRKRESYIQLIYSGNGWKLLMKYYRLRDRLLPEGTMGRKLLDAILH